MMNKKFKKVEATKRHLLIAVALAGFFTGCTPHSFDEYHIVEKSVARSVSVPPAATAGREPPSRSRDRTVQDAPADAVVVENISLILTDGIETGVSTLTETEASVSALQIANPRRVEVLIPNKHLPTDRKTGALRLTYDDLNLLNVLNMDPVTPDAVEWMPEWLTSLNGRMVRIRGFMYPPFMAEDLDRFVLLRDNLKCCYGPGAKVYDFIEVHMKAGTTTDYIPLSRPFDVVGRLKIDLQSAGDSIYSLYVLEEASVLTR